MQTFLPYPDFSKSAQCLDRQRLGKQRVEVLTILKTLLGKSTAWQHHPVVKMWRGHEKVLARYGLAICEEWIKRGYKDTCYQKIVDLFDGVIPFQDAPEWLNEEFCREHRRILLEKDFAFYSKKFDALEIEKYNVLV